MVDILIRNVDEQTAAQLKRKAKAQGKSMSDFARETLKQAAKPSMDELWAEADALRKKIGKVSGDSTDIIREWRDNKDRYR